MVGGPRDQLAEGGHSAAVPRRQAGFVGGFMPTAPVPQGLISQRPSID